MAGAGRVIAATAALPDSERIILLENELVALEGAVEQLISTDSTLRWVLGGVLQHLYGRDPKPGSWGALASETLYPEHIEQNGVVIRHAQAKSNTWRRPARRWKAYGSKAELVRIAADAGVKVDRWGGREWIVRALWRAGVLPGEPTNGRVGRGIGGCR